jgi:hypothetical protein
MKEHLVSPVGAVSGSATVSILSKIAFLSESPVSFDSAFFVFLGAGLDTAFVGVFVDDGASFLGVGSDCLALLGVDLVALSTFGAGLGSMNSLSSSDRIASTFRFFGGIFASFFAVWGVFEGVNLVEAGLVFSVLLPFEEVCLAGWALSISCIRSLSKTNSSSSTIKSSFSSFFLLFGGFRAGVAVRLIRLDFSK